MPLKMMLRVDNRRPKCPTWMHCVYAAYSLTGRFIRHSLQPGCRSLGKSNGNSAVRGVVTNQEGTTISKLTQLNEHKCQTILI